MKFKLIKNLFYIFVLINSFSLLINCGQKETQPSTKTSSEAGKTVITCDTFEWVNDIKEREKLFESQHPDIDVVFQFIPHQQYFQKLITTYMAGTSSDVLICMTGRHKTFIEKGMLRPLNDFIEKDKSLNIDDFYQVPIKEQFTQDGKIYELPEALDCLALYYNKTLFDKAGVPYPDPEKSMTWEEFRDIAKKLTIDEDKDGSPDIYGCVAGFDGNTVLPSYYKYVLFLTFGANFYSEDGKTAYFDSPEIIEAMQFLHSLIYKYKCAPLPSVAQQMGPTMFYINRLGMVINGPWVSITLNQDFPDVKWGVAPAPHKEGKPRKNMAGGPGVAISSRCKNPEAAWELVKFLTSTEIQLRLSEGLPSRKSVYSHPKFNMNDTIRVFQKELEIGTSAFFVQKYDEVNEVFEQTGEKLLMDSDESKIEDSLKNLNKQINEIINK